MSRAAEQVLAVQQRERIDAASRETRDGQEAIVRIAKTVNPLVGSYPTTPQRTYPIVFVDGDFTNTSVNTSAVTTVNRQSTAANHAYTERTTLIPNSTLLVVCRHRGKWYIVMPLSG